MTSSLTPLPDRPAWKSLSAHYQQIKDRHIRLLFADDSSRGQRFTLDALGIYFDYSKNRISDETLRLLMQLAEQSNLKNRIAAMFAGERINTTEDRSVLHIALRAPRNSTIKVNGENVVPQVHAVLD